jgi:hypothetical protein
MQGEAERSRGRSRAAPTSADAIGHVVPGTLVATAPTRGDRNPLPDPVAHPAQIVRHVRRERVSSGTAARPTPSAVAFVTHNAAND